MMIGVCVYNLYSSASEITLRARCFVYLSAVCDITFEAHGFRLAYGSLYAFKNGPEDVLKLCNYFEVFNKPLRTYNV